MIRSKGPWCEEVCSGIGSSSVGLGAVISGHEGDLETSSDVTLESHDTWGGLAPAPPQPLLSEEVRPGPVIIVV